MPERPRNVHLPEDGRDGLQDDSLTERVEVNAFRRRRRRLQVRSQVEFLDPDVVLDFARGGSPEGPHVDLLDDRVVGLHTDVQRVQHDDGRHEIRESVRVQHVSQRK